MPRPLIAALAVAVLGLALLAAGYANPGSLCDDLHPEWVPDGVATFPPGAAECHRHVGPRTVRTTILPWGDWATVALVAASAGLFLAALSAPRRRAAKTIGACALFLAALFAWFFGSWAIWGSLLAVAAVATAATVRRSAAPR